MGSQAEEDYENFMAVHREVEKVRRLA